MRLFVCGKGQAADDILRQLAKEGSQLAVWTMPGAGLVNTATELDIPYSVADVNDMLLWPFQPDVIVSVGYLRIFKAPTIAAVRIINCHYALLPRHRGRSSVPWAILDGDSVTGVTWHWVDTGIDTGNIILQATTAIDRAETALTLFAKLHKLAADYFAPALQLARLDYPGIEQYGTGTYHEPGPPHGGIINPSWPDDYTERFIRAMSYPPMPYARLNGTEVLTFAQYRAMRPRPLFAKAQTEWIM